MAGIVLPYALFFGAFYYYRQQRRERLTQYVENWNRWAMTRAKHTRSVDIIVIC